MPANIEPAKLKAISPFKELDQAHIKDLLKQGQSLEMGDGKVIFKRGEVDDLACWLIEGSVDLLDKNFQVAKVDAASIASHGQLDGSNPAPHQQFVKSRLQLTSPTRGNDDTIQTRPSNNSTGETRFLRAEFRNRQDP